MRMTKILAMLVAIAMTIAVVPGLAITAGAEEANDVVTVNGSKYRIVDGNNFATNGSFDSNWDGWTQNNGGGSFDTANTKRPNGRNAGYTLVPDGNNSNYLKIDGNWGQSYYYSPTDSGGDNRRVLVPTTYWEGAEANKKYYMSFDMMVHGMNPSKNNYVYYGVYKANSFNLNTFGTDFSSRSDIVCSGNIAAGKRFATVDDEWVTVSTVVDVTEAGYFGFQWTWIQDYDYVCLDNFKIYEVIPAETTESAKVRFMDGETTVYEYTVDGLCDNEKFTPDVDEGGYYASEDQGFLYTIGKPDTITVSAGGDNVAQVPLTKFRKLVGSVGTYNKIENGDFENGTAPNNFTIGEGSEFGRSGKVLKGLARSYNENGGTRTANGIGGTYSFQKTADVKVGTSYYYSIDVYQNNNGAMFMSYAFADQALKCAGDDDQTLIGTAYITEGCKSDISGNKELSGTAKFASAYKNQWYTINGVVTAPENAKIFEFDAYYFCDAIGSAVDNVQFYELDLLDTQKMATVKQTLNGETLAEKSAVITDGEEISLPAAAFYRDGAIYNVEEAKATYTQPTVEVKAVKDDTKIPAARDGFFTPNYSGSSYSNNFEPYINGENENDICLYGAADKDPFGLIAKIVEKDPTSKGNGSITSTNPSKKTRVGYVEFKAPEGFLKGDKVKLTLNTYKNEGIAGSKIVAIPTDYPINDATKSGEAIKGADLMAKDEYYFSDALTDKYTGPVTIDITGVKADENGNIKLLLVVPNGVIWFSIMERADFGNTQQGKVSYIEVTSVDHPTAPTASLGWDAGTNKFTINAAAKADEGVTGFNVYGYDEDNTTKGEAEKNVKNDKGVIISTDLTNKLYEITALAGEGDEEVESAPSEKVSIYSLVVDALTKVTADNTDGDTIVKAQADAASEVISDGGLYLTATEDSFNLPEKTADLFDVEGKKLMLKDALVKAGVTLESISYQVGADGKSKQVTVEDGKTVDLSDVGATEEVAIYLENIEFVIESAGEEIAADEAVSGELDFVEEV